MTTEEWNKRTIARGIRLDPDGDADIIAYLAEKKREGMSFSGLVRYLIRKEIRKEKKYETESKH